MGEWRSRYLHHLVQFDVQDLVELWLTDTIPTCELLTVSQPNGFEQRNMSYFTKSLSIPENDDVVWLPLLGAGVEVDQELPEMSTTSLITLLLCLELLIYTSQQSKKLTWKFPHQRASLLCPGLAWRDCQSFPLYETVCAHMPCTSRWVATAWNSQPIVSNHTNKHQVTRDRSIFQILFFFGSLKMSHWNIVRNRVGSSRILNKIVISYPLDFIQIHIFSI